MNLEQLSGLRKHLLHELGAARRRHPVDAALIERLRGELLAAERDMNALLCAARRVEPSTLHLAQPSNP
ncbi:MAG: hypothetical protein ABW220_01995 [Burkholderiaceae bacterium]